MSCDVTPACPQESMTFQLIGAWNVRGGRHDRNHHGGYPTSTAVDFNIIFAVIDVVPRDLSLHRSGMDGLNSPSSIVVCSLWPPSIPISFRSLVKPRPVTVTDWLGTTVSGMT